MLKETIELPAFQHPFAVWTDKECMLLWAETNYDKGMWVNALNALMQSTGDAADQALWLDTEIASNSIPKTKKNKFAAVETM